MTLNNRMGIKAGLKSKSVLHLLREELKWSIGLIWGQASQDKAWLEMYRNGGKATIMTHVAKSGTGIFRQ